MPQILIVEDEKDIQQVLEYNLRQAGHGVLSALSGKEGLRMAQEHTPDLVLLDLMLPDLPGTQVCRALKGDPRTQNIPVLILTARGEEIDRVVGFELGADDYVIKPFSVRELLLRIQAILRRGQPSTHREAGDLVEFGCLRIDRSGYRVWVADKEIKLTAMEFKLLLALYEGRSRVQTRTMLLDNVWNIEADVTTRTVDTHIKRLREKIGPAGNYIETVRGVGYRFVDLPDEAPR